MIVCDPQKSRKGRLSDSLVRFTTCTGGISAFLGGFLAMFAPIMEFALDRWYPQPNEGRSTNLVRLLVAMSTLCRISNFRRQCVANDESKSTKKMIFRKTCNIFDLRQIDRGPHRGVRGSVLSVLGRFPGRFHGILGSNHQHFVKNWQLAVNRGSKIEVRTCADKRLLMQTYARCSLFTLLCRNLGSQELYVLREFGAPIVIFWGNFDKKLAV